MAEANANSRLEAFCDGVFAIAMTLLVIELKLPSPESIHSTADFWHSTMRENRRNGFFAFVLYSLFSIIALWFPMTIAILTTLTWIFWLTLGIRMKHA